MDEQSTDVKTEDASSASSDVTAASSAESTATPSEKDVKPFDAAAIAQKVFDAHVEKEESSTEDEKEGEESVSIVDTDKTAVAADKVEKANEDTDTTAKTDDKQHEAEVPYKRFEEVNTKLKSLEEQMEKSYKPKAEVYDQWVNRMQENNVAESDFVSAIEILCLMNSDPVKAKAALEPIWNQLNGLTGDALPKDLQDELEGIDKEVEDSLLSPTRAAQLKARVHEVAKLRGQSKFAEKRGQMTAQQQQTQAMQQATTAAVSALGSWAQSKQATDPDFSSTGEKYKYFTRILEAELTKLRGIPTPQQTIQLAETLLTEVNGTFKKFAPKGAPNKGLSATKSSTTQTVKPKTMTEMVAMRLAKQGVKLVQDK